MWKNGKEGNTEGRLIMEGKDGRRLKRKKKTEPRKGGRCKGHRADIWQRYEAKHCSSLCSQSEGGEYCGGQARAENPTKSWPERWSCLLRVRGPHFARKVSYNAGAATDDYAALTQISAARALLPIFNLEHPKVIRWPSILLLFSECPPAFDCVSSCIRSCLVPRSLKSIGTETRKTLLLVDICGFENIQMKG